jgi:hypothetical protein
VRTSGLSRGAPDLSAFSENASAWAPALAKAGMGAFRTFRRNTPRILMSIRANVEWAVRRPRLRPHGLPAPLILSVTSYPARFKTLALTIKCLLSQTIAPDAVVLWIANADKEALPRDVIALQQFGLTIEYTADIRSYKKIIPALRRFPGAFIATADDDVYYWSTWLEELVNAYSSAKREILCHRVHKIRLGADGLPLPYTQWNYQYGGFEASPLIFPTGVGGILYAPGRLHPDVVDEATFRTLCPSTDDAWLYWMGLRAGSQFRRTELSRPVRWPRVRGLSMIPWPDSQKVSLSRSNFLRGDGNDVQIRNLIDRFGFPPAPQ